MNITSFYYKKTDSGICILRCRSLDTAVVIPEEIEGIPVTELGDYVCSEICRNGRNGVWDCGKEPEDLPGLWGSRLTELSLPDTIRKVGKYAFYNCENLEKLSCSTSTLDWGAGAFTGCRRISQLEFTEGAGPKSCFQEIISELSQTLWVHYYGKQESRLLFPEFFEESVENTPARILATRIHGCGHQYRYCFKESEFQYQDYDSLFPHVKVQETEETVLELAEARLLLPGGLTEENRQMYLELSDRTQGHGGGVCHTKKRYGTASVADWTMQLSMFRIFGNFWKKCWKRESGDSQLSDESAAPRGEHRDERNRCRSIGRKRRGTGNTCGAPAGASKETAGASGVRKSGRRKFEL